MKIIFIMMASIIMNNFAHECTLKVFTGTAIHEIMPLVIEERNKEFRNYPYLYVHEANNDYNYDNFLCNNDKAIIVVAYHDEKAIGYVTGVPLTHFLGHDHYPHAKDAWENTNLNSNDYFYTADGIIFSQKDRHHGILKKLYAAFEEQFRLLGYTHNCFVTESHDEHPLKPKDYYELSKIWEHNGYTKLPFPIIMYWPTLQADGSIINEYQHELFFWIK